MSQLSERQVVPVNLRRVPYPYKAMLAICSDLDETPDRHVYGEISRYLNTCDHTAMGPGVGLEVGNSVFFDMAPGQFSYWNTDDAGREMLRTLIRSGYVDCLHSYGDLATTRAHAERALEELAGYDCRLRVWVDHAVAPTNFGQDIMRGRGDVPGDPAYHADLSCAAGIEYVWRGRVTSVIGQDLPRNLGGVFNPGVPWQSAGTVLKEAAKGFAGTFFSQKYRMHRSNDLVRKDTLRDGREIKEFIRFDPYWGGVGSKATAAGLATVLTDRMLSFFAERGGLGILYTHLGKVRNRQRPFDEETCRAFERLSRRVQDRQILVATTLRVLRYCQVRDQVRVTSCDQNGEIHLRLSSSESSRAELTRDEVSGLTLYVEDHARTRVFLGGREVIDVVCNGKDETGRKSVSVPWKKLDYPAVE